MIATRKYQCGAATKIVGIEQIPRSSWQKKAAVTLMTVATVTTAAAKLKRQTVSKSH